MRHAGLLGVLVVLALTAGNAGALSPKIPEPPEGWEENLTPGFEPAIEAVLVGQKGQAVPPYEALPAIWGTAAGPVLLRLFRDAAWRDYREKLLRMLREFKDPGTLGLILQEAEDRLRAWEEAWAKEVDARSSRGFHDTRLHDLMPLLAYSDDADTEAALVDVIRRAPDRLRPALLSSFVGRPERQESDLSAIATIREVCNSDTQRALDLMARGIHASERAQECMADMPSEPQPPREDDTGPELLEAWAKTQYLFGTPPREPLLSGDEKSKSYRGEREELLESVTGQQRRSVEKELVRRLGSLGTAKFGARSLVFYAGVARYLGLQDALDAVQDCLAGFPGAPDAAYLDEVVQHLVDARGDRLTPYFRAIADDAEADPGVRMAALVGLGKIGSRRSVRAFQELREAARAKHPCAPRERESYTHAERMGETMALVLEHMPFEQEDIGEACKMVIPYWGRVSEDYARGEVGGFGFRRYGDEWLLVELRSPSVYPLRPRH